MGIPFPRPKKTTPAVILKPGKSVPPSGGYPFPGKFDLYRKPGELFSPVDFYVGENCRVLVHSVAEGDDKPLKFPRAYAGTDLVILNKIDLLPFSDFSPKKFTAHLRQVNPGAELLAVSCRTGVGLDSWRDWLLKYCGESLVEESG